MKHCIAKKINRIRRCTCKTPPPVIDVSNSIRLEDNHEQRISDQMLAACASHGCFYLLVDFTASPQARVGGDDCLTWDNVQKFYLPRLFDYYNDRNHETSSLLEFQSSSVENNKEDGNRAIFRGREAESGSSSVDNGNDVKGEPKQSLEFQRCFIESNENTNYSEVLSSLNEREFWDEPEKLLKIWNLFLHDVAVVIGKYLKLSGDFLADNDHASSIDLLHFF